MRTRHVALVAPVVPVFLLASCEDSSMLVWDHALTAPERLAVEQYFQRRY